MTSHNGTFDIEMFEQFRAVLDSFDAGVYVADLNSYEMLFLNKYGQDRWGEYRGKRCYEVLQAGQKSPCSFCTNSRLLNQQGEPAGVYRWEFQNTVTGEWFDCRDEAIYWVDGRLARIEIATNITERKLAEQQLESSLAEKEMLLKEVHHRGKNNLQVIASLLSLQALKVASQEAIDALTDSGQRVQLMAQVHNRLYQSDNLTQIDFSEFLKSALNEQSRIYDAATRGIKLTFDLQDIALTIDQAIPCGLIISELVTNALKHAFPNGKDGEIKIGLTEPGEDRVEILVSDNGVGIGETDGYSNDSSLGLEVVETLISQLHGDMSVDSTEGTKYRFCFTRTPVMRNNDR